MNAQVFVGGPIVTMDPAHPNPEAIGTLEGRIASVGRLVDVRNAVGSNSRTIDLAGRTLLPGFIDAHSHILWGAKTRGEPVVDVRAVTVPTYRALLGKVRRRVAAAKPGEYLLFFGLDAQLHPDMEAPTRAQLDEIAPDNPIGIQVSNAHALYMNSHGFEACGIDENTPTPTGSIVDRDDMGRPTGRIAEAITWDALETFYDAWGDSRLSAEFESSIGEFISNGITTVTEHHCCPVN